jgi:hypothetical protein
MLNYKTSQFDITNTASVITAITSDITDINPTSWTSHSPSSHHHCHNNTTPLLYHQQYLDITDAAFDIVASDISLAWHPTSPANASGVHR